MKQTLRNFVLEYLGQIGEPLARIGESNWKLRLTKLLPERKNQRFAKHTFANRHCVILKPNPNPKLNLNLKQAICEFHFSDWEGPKANFKNQIHHSVWGGLPNLSMAIGGVEEENHFMSCVVEFTAKFWTIASFVFLKASLESIALISWCSSSELRGGWCFYFCQFETSRKSRAKWLILFPAHIRVILDGRLNVPKSPKKQSLKQPKQRNLDEKEENFRTLEINIEFVVLFSIVLIKLLFQSWLKVEKVICAAAMFD